MSFVLVVHLEILLKSYKGSCTDSIKNTNKLNNTSEKKKLCITKKSIKDQYQNKIY